MDHLSEHNSRLKNLAEIKEQCYQQYRSDNTPFSDLCNISSEYSCFRADVDDPFNVKLNRPCINLTAIGDGKTDCLTGLDERNRLECADRGMLGFQFQYSRSLCMLYAFLCRNPYRWTPGNNDMYGGVCFYRRTLSRNETDSNCDSDKDVMCLNNTCIRNARCNGRMECLHGEDEYRCMPQDKSQIIYRIEKQTSKQIRSNPVPTFPSLRQPFEAKSASLQNDTDHYRSHIVFKRNSLLDLRKERISDNYLTTIYEKRHLQVKSTYEIVRDALSNGTITFKQHYLPFICNRGVAIKYYTGHTVCFCSSSAYGPQCEFYSDRILVQTHLNLTNYRPTSDRIAIIKVLVTFLFQNQIIDYDVFHVDPWREKDKNYIKHHIYFVYPRTEMYLQMKKTNRSGTQLYSVRFEAFDLHLNGKIEPIGVWQYPIYFDFLPSFRLSKILRFHPPILSLSHSPCFENRCGQNGICREVLRSNHSSYFCSCHSGYYGADCKSYDEECNNCCSPKSICKPEYREMIRGNQRPLCLCPASTFGSTCFVKNDPCRPNPCLHGGTCVAAYDVTNINSYVCVCSDGFEGDHCQSPGGIVDMTIKLSSDSMLQTADVLAVTVSYSDVHPKTFEFVVRRQQVFDTLPSHIQLIYGQRFQPYVPPIAVMKVYGSSYHSEIPKYYILYVSPPRKEINITTDLTLVNHCPLVQTLWHLLSEVQPSSKSN